MDNVQSPISPFFFDLHISATEAVLLAAAALLCAVAVFLTWQRLASMMRHKRRCDTWQGDSSGRMPDVSVVIFSQDNAENLETLIPAILGQEYSGAIEVIVVNDGESSSVSRVVGMLKAAYPNIYMTYTPDGARNLSRKKLAITLGVKASRHPVVVHTHAAVRLPEGNTWLQRMMRHFADPGMEVVLGFASPSFTTTDKPMRTVCLDFMADSATWLSSALAGNPFMGTFMNIAYRRDVFFRNKGFSHSLRLNNGEDDIFVSEIANSANTAVELADEAIVDSNYNDIAEDIDLDRQAHVFTSRFVTRKPRRMMATAIWAMWLSLACCAASVAVSPLNLATDAAALVIAIALMVWPSVYWSKFIRLMGGRRLRLTVPWLVLTRPVRNMMLKMRARTGDTKNYTWN